MKCKVYSVMLGCFLSALTLCATTVRTWQGPANGDWFAPANWLADDLSVNFPQDGDDVKINSGSLLLTNATAALASLTVTNATIVFTNWVTSLNATNMVLKNKTVLTVANAFRYGPSFMTNRVWVIADNFKLESGAAINVSGKGFLVGAGPAKGAQSGSNNNAGGGHGGRGGDEGGGAGGPEWGSREAPLWPGSGGGQYSNDAGGNGGGAVRIEAATVIVNGMINANGETGSQYNGGGAGGSVYISCDTFAGTNGTISADGGNGGSAYDGGGGGGGRIAVHYGNLSVPCSVTFSTKAGALYTRIPAICGTLWLSDSGLARVGATTLFDNVRLAAAGWNGITVTNPVFNGRSVAFGDNGGFKMEVVGSLIISNNSCVTIGGAPVVSRSVAAESASLAATNAALLVTDDILISGGTLCVGGIGQAGCSVLESGGNVTLTNNAARAAFLNVVAGLAPGGIPDGGIVNISGTLAIASNSWYQPYSHPTNGGSLRMVASNVVIAAGGGIDASAKGFVSYSNVSYGPGVGISSGSRGGGGGYGGRGGRGSDAHSYGGVSYGETNRPLFSGSAGGFGYASQAGYGNGGGHVRLETGGLRLDGAIRANGRQPIAQYSGGGAGGGIMVVCDSLAGGTSGELSAKGAAGGNEGGGGGGGRIAVAIGMAPVFRAQLLAGAAIDGLIDYSQHGPFLGAVSAASGVTPGGYTPLASPGTARFLTYAPGTFMLLVDGDPGQYGASVPYNYGANIAIDPGSVITNAIATPVAVDSKLRRALVGWAAANSNGTVLASGMASPAVFTMTEDVKLTWFWTNEYYLAVNDAPNGAVNGGIVNGWYVDKTDSASITATANAGYRFLCWVGDVPPALAANNPLTLVMDKARTINAEFVSESGEIKTWKGSGSWSDFTKWIPAGAPGPDDSIFIASGTLTVPAARMVKSLVVSNGTTMVFTNWQTSVTAKEDMIVSGQVTLPAPFAYNQEMSNRVWLVCRNFMLATNGQINVAGKGYFTHTGPGVVAGGGSDKGSGGGHGGKGGNSSDRSGGVTNGNYLAPLAPGSGGGGSYDTAGGHGGGAVFIDAVRDVTINGIINANGNAGATYNGGGAGGSVFIAAGNSFSGNTNASITANGGNRGTGFSSLGGGGGGRIAVWLKINDAAHRASLLGGQAVKLMETNSVLPAYLGAFTANAAASSYAPPGNGTALFIRVAPMPGSVLLLR